MGSVTKIKKQDYFVEKNKFILPLYSRSCAAEIKSFSGNDIPKRCKILGNELYGIRPDGSV
jgi:hypothetical protein